MARPKFDYSLDYKNLDMRKHPDLYRVGKWEQGVLLVEPYKSEILPYWRFKTPEIAEKSSKKILTLFRKYKKENDFIGMDMARKFLQMWYTRSRRYANHASGRKYSDKNLKDPKEIGEVPKDFNQRNQQHYINTKTKKILPIETDTLTSEKAESARIFYGRYLTVREDPKYKKLKQDWQEKYW